MAQVVNKLFSFFTWITIQESWRNENVFKCIFLNENVGIKIKIALKFVPMGLIDSE